MVLTEVPSSFDYLPLPRRGETEIYLATSLERPELQMRTHSLDSLDGRLENANIQFLENVVAIEVRYSRGLHVCCKSTEKDPSAMSASNGDACYDIVEGGVLTSKIHIRDVGNALDAGQLVGYGVDALSQV